MKNTGRQHRIGAAFSYPITQVLQIAHTAGGYNRNRHRIADRTGYRQVITFFGAVAIHTGKQDFPGAKFRHFDRPLHRINAGRFTPAVGENLPARRFTVHTDLFRVYRHHYALGTKTIRSRFHKLRVVDSRRVDADFISTGIEHGAYVIHGANTAANRERDKHFAGDFLHRMHRGIAPFVSGGDIEKSDFIGAIVVIALGDLHRITSIADTDKIDALNHTAIIDIEAGNNAFCECHKFYVSYPISIQINCLNHATRRLVLSAAMPNRTIAPTQPIVVRAP